MTKPYTVLSLDLGTKMGWCFISDAQYRYSGVLSLPKHTDNPGLHFLTFQNWLHKFRGVSEIFYEDVPRFESKASAQVYCGQRSVLHIFRTLHGMKLTSIKSNSVKKVFTGNGNADKALMCKVAHQLGWKGGHPDTDIDHDEADAIATAYVILQRKGAELTF
jgi:crossover junction endodeoxyribonuclease RuvC